MKKFSLCARSVTELIYIITTASKTGHMETELTTAHLMPLLSKTTKSTQANFSLLDSIQKSTGRLTAH